ncbi:hypothetical protein GCM10027599_19160 [Yimella radicis]
MSLSEYQIRRPRMTDADALGRAHVQIWREAYRGLMTHEALAALDPGTRADRWRTIIETTPPQRRTFVAEHRDTAELVGFITVDESRDEDPPTPLELWALNVVSAHHGTGVAQARRSGSGRSGAGAQGRASLGGRRQPPRAGVLSPQRVPRRRRPQTR